LRADKLLLFKDFTGRVQIKNPSFRQSERGVSKYNYTEVRLENAVIIFSYEGENKLLIFTF